MYTQIDQHRAESLLAQARLTPEELAELACQTPFAIRHAVRVGELPALVIDHHIVSIQRGDAITWLQGDKGRAVEQFS